MGELNAATCWWDCESDPKKAGASRLLRRCQQVMNWSPTFSHRVLMGYMDFLEMKKDANDFEGNQIVPSTVVHQMWRQHILDTHNYTKYCCLLVGERVEYPADDNPISDSKTKNKRIANTRSRLCQRKNCEPVELDEEIWAYERPPMVQLPVGASSIKTKEAQSAGVTIFIQCIDQSEKNSSEFKVIESMKLSRIFQAYAKQRGVNRNSLTFLLRSSSQKADENDEDKRILLHDENGKPTHQPLDGTETPLKLFSGNGTINNGRQLWIDCEPRRCEC
ncbi:unnamed protein product [Cylindrotheca closterium]|uniref:Uncharacterized protein n=1 Tax=Cylindrotheca closterium TaxID=2856 RepID=A0AAD2CPA5_9STRA|nr:unnamed protein product [Cylindrotheca closterium]